MSKIKVSAVILATAVVSSFVLTGCYPPPPAANVRQAAASSYGSLDDENITEKTYAATEALLQRTLQPLDKSTPVLVATLVNVDELDESSSLGRYLAEVIAGRMVQLGYDIRDVNLRGTMAIRKDVGQLMLSRDLRHLRSRYNAQAVVAGTYAVGDYKAHISLKLIGAATGRVISATNYSLNLGPDTQALVRTANSNRRGDGPKIWGE